jgi:hypothetical protein
MKTKSNVILILSTLSFVLLILGKPTFNTTKHFLINKTTTCELIVGSPEYYRSIVPVTTTVVGSIPIIPQRGISGLRLLPLPCGLGGTENIDYQINNNYSLRWFNFLKLISLVGIITSLFIRYKKRI